MNGVSDGHHMTQGDKKSMRLAGSVLGTSRHVCAFFDGPEEEYRVLLPFVKEGIEQGDKGFHILDSPQHADHLRRMQEDGIDVARAEENKQLEVHSWQETYLSGGRFAPDAMLSTIEDALNSGRADGFPLTRLMGHVEWIVEDWPGTDVFLEYECRLNYLLPQYDDAVICLYDLSKLGGPLVMDVLRAHPMVIIGGRLNENPFYVPPDELLSELRA
jgi:hypothetical protein